VNRSRDWLTLREIDERDGAPKGTAFRSFKRIEPGLAEGRDYRLLQAARDAAEIAALRKAERIYRASVNVVLLSPATAERVGKSAGRIA
jgi:hypothetical protein